MSENTFPFPAHEEELSLALSVVVPCFNEEEVLDELHRRITAVCKDTLGLRNNYEVIMINDGSVDRTWEKIKDLAQNDFHVIGINLSRNHGHQLALSAGLTVCRGDRILVIDADLQDPPEVLPEMMRLMDEGADVVYGQRTEREGESWFKTASAGLFYRLLDRLVDVKIPVDTGDFRLMSRRALEIFNAMPERNRFIRGMVSWIGLRQVPLHYQRQQRFAGETKYPLRKMVALAIDAVTSFSTVPLRLASHLGISFGLVGILVLCYVFYGWISGNVVRGWTSVISVILIIGSVHLLVIGIIGEYVGRMFTEIKRRPLFIIDEMVYRSEATKIAMPRHELQPKAYNDSVGAQTSSPNYPTKFAEAERSKKG